MKLHQTITLLVVITILMSAFADYWMSQKVESPLAVRTMSEKGW